jgi:hypothetical protein
MLNEFWNHALSGDEVGHGHVRHLYETPGDSIRQPRDAINHDERIANERGFDGGSAAGDYGGARMEKRGAGIVDQMDGERAAAFGVSRL